MDNPFLGQVLLEFVEIRAELLDFPMLDLGDSPDQQRDFYPILGKHSRHRFAQETSRQIADLKTSLDRVIVRKGNKIHPCPTKSSMQIAWIRDTSRNAKTPQQPLRGAEAVSGMEMKIDARHDQLVLLS